MNRPFAAGLLAVLLAGAWGAAQTPESPRLRWPAAGAVLAYRIESATTQTHSVKDATGEAKVAVKVTKRWKVESVDPAGTAKLSMSLTSMQQHRTTSSGSEWKYDSDNPKDSTPAMREALSKHIDTEMATVKVDAWGRVAEAKPKVGDASAFENELPFVGVLPGAAMKAGLAWERAYKITLMPPLGTGEKYDAIQKFVCKEVKDGVGVVSLVTELKEKPKAAGDLVPLWEMLPKGELKWDLKAGRLLEARLVVEEELKGHEGEGSHTKYASTKTIKLVADK